MQRTYKVPASTYFGLGLFASGLAFVILIAPLLFATKDSPTKILLISVVAIAIPIATIWWLSCFKIIITPDALIYSSAFGRHQSVNLVDITDSRFVKRMGIIGAQPLLEIKSPQIKFTIHFKIFSHEARKDLFHAVKIQN